ncbi:MAG: queuosine precursor transporter [Treponema sp.]|nr:queuosine precursor transporter [Treponema sp.]
MSFSSQTPSYKYLDVIAAFFVGILIVSNIASSAKIVDLGFSIFSIPLVFDGGTLLFPLAYILGDVLTEVYGFKTTRRVIWTGFAAMILAVLIFFVLGALPAESFWAEETGGDAAYSAILGGMSYGGIVLASLCAYLVGEFSNAAVLVKIKEKTKGRFLWIRTIGSSLVGQFLDTTIFVLIATVTGVFGWEIFWSLVITNYILKCGIEAIFTPFTYWISNFLKKKEISNN